MRKIDLIKETVKAMRDNCKELSNTKWFLNDEKVLVEEMAYDTVLSLFENEHFLKDMATLYNVID